MCTGWSEACYVMVYGCSEQRLCISHHSTWSSYAPYAAQQLLWYPYQERVQDWQCLFSAPSTEFQIKVCSCAHLSNQEVVHF